MPLAAIIYYCISLERVIFSSIDIVYKLLYTELIFFSIMCAVMLHRI